MKEWQIQKTSKAMIALMVWWAISFIYIAYSMYMNFQYSVMQSSYMQWKTDTITELLKQAENKECQPFNVYSQDKKIDLINVACLQQWQNQQVQEAPNKPEVPQK